MNFDSRISVSRKEIADDELIIKVGITQCETCMKMSSIVWGGEENRFCHQCGGFHPLQAFEGDMRSCRVSLLRRRTYRRKKLKNDNGTAGEADVGPEVTHIIDNCVLIAWC
jgi:hypothetical protein